MILEGSNNLPKKKKNEWRILEMVTTWPNIEAFFVVTLFMIDCINKNMDNVM